MGFSKFFVLVVVVIRQIWSSEKSLGGCFALLTSHNAFTVVTTAMMMPSMKPLLMALEGDEMVNGWTCVWWIEIRGLACWLDLLTTRIESRARVTKCLQPVSPLFPP